MNNFIDLPFNYMPMKHKLREDKTCLNCNYVVENRYCPNCGQENSDTRKTFYELFVHFFEDLTHYENSFWKTIRNLILKPASLTKEYLSGKRMSYLAPIRLYIFISFVTFFIFSILPDSEENEHDNHKPKAKKEYYQSKPETKKDSIYPEEVIINDLEKKGAISKTFSDSIQKAIKESKENADKDDGDDYMNFGYSSVEELDSVQKSKKPNQKMSALKYWLHKKVLLAKKGKTKEEAFERFKETFFHNIPKALFIYMPLFAFILWLFQNKRKWYYFDHGIFTLHYFSFLLLASLILELFNLVFDNFDNFIMNGIQYIFNTVLIIYMLYYFFPAHHRFYNEKRIVTIIKGVVMFFINIIILSLILVGIAFYSFINIH